MSHIMLPVSFEPILKKEFADIIELQFNKRFTFSEGYRDPPDSKVFSSAYWLDERLQAMKTRLNECKAKLNEMPLKRWHMHTKKMNPAFSVGYTLRKTIGPELLTQAWEKFHECFHVFDLGPKEEDFNSVHLCEAPGAFVTSLNHALVTHHPDVKWNWIATTLNPHYEGNSLGYMINDDRFIVGSLDHWEFGVDNSGDLMVKDNLAALVERSKKDMKAVHLVTADGSIDCQADPGRQESLVAKLLESEAIAALNILSEGGNFVIKMFTMFESETICLMYLLNIAFKQVEVFKPATSKEGNSEVYVICKNYHKSRWIRKFLESVQDIYGDFPDTKSMFAESDIPEDFMAEIRECQDLYLQLQENVIENNLHYFKETLKKPDFQDLRELQTQVAEKFIEKYKVEEIASYRFVVYKRANPFVSQIDDRSEHGSYLDRLAESNMEPRMKLKNIREMMLNWKSKGKMRFIQWVPAPAMGTNLAESVRGKKLTKIQSSKFCTGRHLQYYNEAIELLTVVREDEEESDEDKPQTKKRKLDKPYSGLCLSLEESVENNKVLNKISKIFPEIVQQTKVLFLNRPYSNHANLLSLECDGKNQLRLIDTLITAINGLEVGDYLILEGFPLFSRISVAIFYCIATLFADIGFVKPSEREDFIFLSKFLTKKSSSATEESLNKLEKILMEILSVKDDKMQVLSVWSVKDLVQDPVYSEMIMFNQLKLKEQVLHLTSFLDPKPVATESAKNVE